MTGAYDVTLFTDGACSGNPGPRGWACIPRHVASGTEKRVAGGDPQTTNNRMELMAVIEGLATLKSDGQAVQVVTDSQYVSRGMTEWLPVWLRNNWRRGRKANAPPVKNVDLWQKLVAQCDRHRVTVTHVRGHAGHPKNEEFDRLAVQAAQAAADRPKR